MAYEIANIKEHGVRVQQWHGGLLWTEATPCFFVLEIGMPYKSDRTLTIGRKHKILERDNNECQYCYGPGDEVDHIIPWAYEHDNSEENLVCCCWMCNRIASDRVFRSFGQKQTFIIERRHRFVKNNPIPLWLISEVKGLGRKLKKEILCGDTMVFVKTDDLLECRRKLLDEGWRVVIGDHVRERIMNISIEKYEESEELMSEFFM